MLRTKDGGVVETTLRRVVSYEVGTAHLGSQKAVFLMLDRAQPTQIAFVLSPSDARKLGHFLLEEAGRCEPEAPAGEPSADTGSKPGPDHLEFIV
jgi:hypothetical protein